MPAHATFDRETFLARRLRLSRLRRRRARVRALAWSLVLASIVVGPGQALASEAVLARPIGGSQTSANQISPALARAINRAKLTASDGAAQDNFAYSVAVSGDTAVVGAPGDDSPAGFDTGAAYVFVLAGNVWTQQAKLTASDGAEFDQFGWSVAVSGDTAVVGAPNDEAPAGFAVGAAYVFVRSGTVWTEQAKITASDGAAGDNFGYSVAVDGDTAVVGAFGDAAGAGSAYVFVRSGTVWAEQAKLIPSDGAGGNNFGRSVALDGDTALVGAPFYNSPFGSGPGSAYVFVRSGTVWTQQAKLTASDGATGDALGYSVAVSVDTAVVGAAFDDTTAGTDAGSAYAFVRSGSVWTEQAKLTASDGAASDSFGYSVGVSGNIAAVGAPFDDTPRGSAAGSAYAFVRSGTVWTQRAKLTAPDGAAFDELGWSLALDGTTGVVGAPFDDLPGRGNAGSAYAIWMS